MLVHGGVDQNETSFNDTYILEGISQFIDNSQMTSIYTAYIPGYEFTLNTQTPTTSVNNPGTTDGIFPTTE